MNNLLIMTNRQKLFYTLGINLKYDFIHYLWLPILIGAGAALICFLKKYIKLKKAHKKPAKIIEKVDLKKSAGIFFSVFYFSVLYQSTIFDRIITGQFKENPLGEVFGGWTIVETTYFYDFSVIWNIVMFLPCAFILYAFCRFVKDKRLKNATIFKLSVLVSFSVSLSIEVMQIVFSVGTFQFSDIFYNTLGGTIGAGVFIAVRKILRQRKLKAQKVNKSIK